MIRAIDKLDKVAPRRRARDCWSTRPGSTTTQATRCLALAEIATTDASFVDQVRALGVEHPLLDAGLDELVRVVEGARATCAATGSPSWPTSSLARGLDYYTGTVFEICMAGYESLGSVCGGGRYDALASDGRTTYPGVGISLRRHPDAGAAGQPRAARRRPVGAVVRAGRAAVDEDVRGATASDRPGAARARHRRPRSRRPRRSSAGRSATPSGAASRTSGSRAVGDGAADQVKDIRSGDQVDADADAWPPPDRRPAPAGDHATDNEEPTP